MSKIITQITSSGERVALCRKLKSLSQQEFASILGVSRGYIGDIENNRSDPSSNFLTLLASKVNISADWVLTGEGAMNRNEKNEIPSPEQRLQEIIALYESLSEDQQKEILASAKEKTRINEFSALTEQLKKLIAFQGKPKKLYTNAGTTEEIEKLIDAVKDMEEERLASKNQN